MFNFELFLPHTGLSSCLPWPFPLLVQSLDKIHIPLSIPSWDSQLISCAKSLDVVVTIFVRISVATFFNPRWLTLVESRAYKHWSRFASGSVGGIEEAVEAWWGWGETLGGKQVSGLTHARFWASLFHPSLGPGPPISARGPCRLHTFLQYCTYGCLQQAACSGRQQHLVRVDWSWEGGSSTSLLPLLTPAALLRTLWSPNPPPTHPLAL